MDKRTSNAFDKDIYLMGKDEEGLNIWLEAPKWDCRWYWGFGYLETYTNNKNPSASRDIISHQHVDSSMLGEKNAKDGGYCHNPFDSKMLDEATFTEDEGWKLGELFRSFYILRKTADYFYHGSAGVTNIEGLNRKDLELAKEINEKLIPVITAQILEILTPKS